MTDALILASPFIEGAKVVHVHYPRFGGGDPRYTERTVAKVWKNGKFFLKDDYNQTGWFAHRNAEGDWSASAKDYGKGELFMADNVKVVERRAELKAQRENVDKFNELMARLTKFNGRNLSTEQLAAIDVVLAAFPKVQ